jgi:hypothetical protein
MRWVPQVLHTSKGKDMENLINLKGLQHLGGYAVEERVI